MFLMKQGAIAGIICGDAVSLWLLIGAYIWKPSSNGSSSALPTYDVNCDITETSQRFTKFEELAWNTSKTMAEEDSFFFVPDG